MYYNRIFFKKQKKNKFLDKINFINFFLAFLHNVYFSKKSYKFVFYANKYLVPLIKQE